MKQYKGKKPHPQMREPYITELDGMSSGSKVMINKLVKKYDLKEKPNA